MKLPAFQSDEFLELLPESILRFESDDAYTTVYLISGESIKVAWHVGACIGRAPEGVFIRLHKRHAVNCQYLAGALFGEGQLCALLVNGDKVPVNERNQNEFEMLARKMGFQQ